MDNSDKFSSLRSGLLEFVILKLIARDQVYVADLIKELATTEFKTQEGTLYPLLSRLRREAVVEYEWQESPTGPPRKYYRLTAKGKEQLGEMEQYWQKIISTLKNFKK
jgi:PadR family transcriptional regulator PadR